MSLDRSEIVVRKAPAFSAHAVHAMLPRSSYAAWLQAHEQTALRLVVAPAGSGKTTATTAWAQQQPGGVAWVDVPAGCDAAALGEYIATALHAASESAARCSVVDRVTVVVDDVENADSSGRAFLARLCAFAPETVTFVYLARSRTALDVRVPECRGLVAVAPPALLSFGPDEIGLYAESLGVRWTPLDCARLHRATGGWAVAVTGAVRAAREVGSPLTEAYSRWFAAEKATVADVVERALESAPSAQAQAFRSVFGPDEPAVTDLAVLARAGLFVDQVGDRLRPNPVLAELLGARWATGLSPDEIAPAQLEMFGRFSLVINECEVRFARRRDAQIVQYLALQPTGRATRAELLDVFWKDGDHQLAAQGLRTAISAIRSAIARCAGPGAVERYFLTDGDAVALRFDAVVSAAHRFESHVHLASAAEARGDTVLAQTHWGAASRLYAAPLLAGEPPAPWIEEAAAEYDFLATAARSRLARRPAFVPYSPVA